MKFKDILDSCKESKIKFTIHKNDKNLGYVLKEDNAITSNFDYYNYFNNNVQSWSINSWNFAICIELVEEDINGRI